MLNSSDSAQPQRRGAHYVSPEVPVMDLVPYTYELPESRIAQRPVYPYHDAKLLVVERASGSIQVATFLQISQFLRPGDVVVFNDTKVIPARLWGTTRKSGAHLEVLLLANHEENLWECIGKPLKRFRVGEEIDFSHGLSALVKARPTSDRAILEFKSEDATVSCNTLIEKVGAMPIPPYIRGGISDQQDRIDYQTHFAAQPGSVAAPTASLHFTPDVIEAITAAGAVCVYVTLHVGGASIFSIVTEDGTIKKPGIELVNASASVIEIILNARRNQKRVFAIGTTVVRALESCARNGTLCGPTDLFITPGFEFKLVSNLATNFHQPGTTHLLLVESMLGRELLDKVYRFALENDFRFLSYGDGMLVL